MMGKRLYVGNLPFDCDEAALRAAFGADGRVVERVHIVLDRDTNRPRGFAFVEMATEDAAKQALAAMNGRILGGRSLRVSEAEDRRPGAAGPAGRAGPPARDRAGADRDGTDRGPGAGDMRPPGGGPRPKPWELGPAYGPPKAPARREQERKPSPRRRHDDEPDFGGRRGARRFDDDDDG